MRYKVWFDGGFEGEIKPFVEAALKRYQPDAVAFNGCVDKSSGSNNPANCISPNSVRWIGTEVRIAVNAARTQQPPPQRLAVAVFVRYILLPPIYADVH